MMDLSATKFSIDALFPVPHTRSQVDEDNTKVRRNPAKPLPEENLFNKRAIYSKGWDLKETTIDSVETYFTEKGYKVLQVRLRRLPVTKDFKGSVFVELSDVEEATKCAAETHKVGETELLVEMKSAYHQRKNAERLAKRKAKAAAKKDKADADGTDGASATKKEDAAPAEEEVYELGCVLKFEGLADDTTREDIKEKLNPIQEVKWVDFQRGDTGGEVRFEEAGSAIKVKAKADEDKVEINKKVPTWTVLEGEEEKVCAASTIGRSLPIFGTFWHVLFLLFPLPNEDSFLLALSYLLYGHGDVITILMGPERTKRKGRCRGTSTLVPACSRTFFPVAVMFCSTRRTTRKCRMRGRRGVQPSARVRAAGAEVAAGAGAVAAGVAAAGATSGSTAAMTAPRPRGHAMTERALLRIAPPFL